jgi:hypothetical protein
MRGAMMQNVAEDRRSEPRLALEDYQVFLRVPRGDIPISNRLGSAQTGAEESGSAPP